MLQPKEGWAHVGCPDCGAIFMLPMTLEERPAWCVHHNGIYSWSAAAAEGSGWTQMVHVTVAITGVAPDP